MPTPNHLALRRTSLAIAAALAACGGGASSTGPAAPGPSGAGAGPGVARDTRSPFEQRLDAACTRVGERLTTCAVEDARARLAAGQTTQAEVEATTRPEVLAENARRWHESCFQRDRSSRQVRVLEVCLAEETRCEPFVACLENLNQVD